MASKRWLTEENITRLLMDEEDPRALEESSNSEKEDYLEVDDYLEVMLKMKFPTMKIFLFLICTTMYESQKYLWLYLKNA